MKFTLPLVDMGVVPDVHYGWNPVNFTIDARKRHLLPTPNPMVYSRSWEEDWLSELEEELADELC